MTRTAVRLALELAAYFLLAATVVEFFEPKEIGARLGDAEANGVQGLGTLAEARRFLALSPGISLSCTQRFREAWKLDGVPES